MFDIIIDNKKYEYVTQIEYNHKKYVAYQDNENVYISEYYFDNDNLILLGVDDNLVEILQKEMKL